MTELKFFKAGCADAARIRYIGSDGQTHNVFIDSGFERTFRSVLAEEIRSIMIADEAIDLWVISHIHSDHIGGIIGYLNAIKSGEFKDIVRGWYYNIPRTPISEEIILNASQAVSIGQGDALAAYLLSIGKLCPNDITNDSPTLNIRGMKISVLSPNSASLASLREKYPFGSKNPLERIEDDTISEAKGKVQNDYHFKLEEFNLESWQEDLSVENGSSISLLIEVGSKKSLWLADAFPGLVSQSLRNLGYSQKNPIICDCVKVSHHGSSGNNSNELYELIDCNNYVITANGENKYNLPTKECIAHILRNRNRNPNSHYNLYFTDDNSTLRSIFINEDEKIMEKLKFSVHFLKRETKAWVLHLT